MRWDEDDIRRFGREVADLAASYIEGLETISLATPRASDLEAALGGPLPEEGMDPYALLDEVRRVVVPGSFHLSSPRYFGLFNPTPTVIGIYADTIASLLNQNAGAWSHAPAGAQIEKTVIRWMCDLAGYGPGAFGTLTSGGTLANITGLKIALTERVPDVRRIGVAAAEGRPTFYVSSQAHYSIDRLADVLGLGSEGMRRIECDPQARMVPEALERRVLADRDDGRYPFCVIGIAGTTISGAIDPLHALADVCARHHLWFHIDAAWGGAARLSRRHAHLLDGIERADSITLDPHKWFSVPYAAGALITRDGSSLRRAFEVEPAYLMDKVFSDHEDLNLFQLGIAGSRRFDALKVWMSLKNHGRRGYEEAIDRQVALAEHLAARVEALDDFQALSRPSLGVLCFRYVPSSMRGMAMADTPQPALDALQMRIQETIAERGRVWVSTSMLGGRRTFRFCATSYLSRERHVDMLIEEMRAAAACLD
ncbi:MAG: pyridoxal phosphate-dependent decarboxylase family protein [Candidatus Polarisedimenticolia bacterium]